MNEGLDRPAVGDVRGTERRVFAARDDYDVEIRGRGRLAAQEATGEEGGVSLGKLLAHEGASGGLGIRSIGRS